MKIDFYNLDNTFDLKYSVIISEDEYGYVLVKHFKRATWEIPGGHIEIGETPLEAANRELREETAAGDYKIEEVCDYSVTKNDKTTFARLFYAYIKNYGQLSSEIEKVKSFKSLPKNLTYPKIHPILLQEVIKRVS